MCYNTQCLTLCETVMHVDSTEFVVAEGKYSLSVSQKVLNFCCDNCGFFLGGGGECGKGFVF